MFLSENKVFGCSWIFKYFIDDLIELETDGFLIGNKRLYFLLCPIVGDNLGFHEILGFPMGFTANDICRMCRVHRDVLRRRTKLDRTLMRTVTCYEEDVLKKDMSSTGIREDCIFKRIPSFHQMKRHEADLLHDFLKVLVQMTCFTLFKLL